MYNGLQFDRSLRLDIMSEETGASPCNLTRVRPVTLGRIFSSPERRVSNHFVRKSIFDASKYLTSTESQNSIRGFRSRFMHFKKHSNPHEAECQPQSDMEQICHGTVGKHPVPVSMILWGHGARVTSNKRSEAIARWNLEFPFFGTD
jgi:hypothetical protein